MPGDVAAMTEAAGSATSPIGLGADGNEEMSTLENRSTLQPKPYSGKSFDN